MPSFLALSVRFSWMPEPGKTMTPIGRTSRIWALRLKGAALASRGRVGEELRGMGGLDQRQALGDETLQFDRSDLRAVLLLLAPVLRALVVVELTLDPVGRAMEQIDGRPQQLLEIGLETSITERRDERIEDVDDGAGDSSGCRQRSGVGIVLERTVAINLELGEDVIGRGCVVYGLEVGIVAVGRHGDFFF